MIYIGVDPGKKGGYAVIDRENVTAYPWDEEAFIKRMSELAYNEWTAGHDFKPIAVVEKVGAMPGQGVTSMFSFGQSYGFILGVLSALGIHCQLVPPGTWKREFGLLHKGKEGSVVVCKRMFPGVSLLPTEKCRKDSDGMADALLMAEYARRKM